MKGLTFEFLGEPSINKFPIKSGQNCPQIISGVYKLPTKSIVINTAHDKGDSFILYLQD